MDEVELPAGAANPDRQPLRQRNGRGRRRRARRILPHPGSPGPRRRALAGRARRRPRLRRRCGRSLPPRRWAGAIPPPACCRSARMPASPRRGESSTATSPPCCRRSTARSRTHLRTAVDTRPISEDAPLARSLKLRLPIVQGPMTRVSDSAEFAAAVADGGALPMVAFALLKGAPLERAARRDARSCSATARGASACSASCRQELRDEQLASAAAFGPSYALIAGGRPDQAVRLEAAGHPDLPARARRANLLPLFLQDGARRFVFEGRECGGHVGPLQQLRALGARWSIALLAELATSDGPGQRHRACCSPAASTTRASAAMVQVLAAPLVARGVKVGVLMGTAYLFTEEIVASGAIVPQFQQEAIDCERTVLLETGPGHASRCAYTPFAHDFFADAASSIATNGMPADESRAIARGPEPRPAAHRLEGHRSATRPERRARVASTPTRSAPRACTCSARSRRCASQVTRIDGAAPRGHRGRGRAARRPARPAARRRSPAAAAPADVAIVGIACVAAEAQHDPRVLAEHPRQGRRDHRDPAAPLGLAALLRRRPQRRTRSTRSGAASSTTCAFDPMRYGMPPKSLDLDRADAAAGARGRRAQALDDAGYHETAVRPRAHLGDPRRQRRHRRRRLAVRRLRSELPRFAARCPPTWPTGCPSGPRTRSPASC